MVLLLLESDGACTRLNEHSAQKCALLVSEWCYKAIGDREQIYENTDHLKATLWSGMTSLQVMVASARSFGWGSNERVTLLYLVTWPSTPIYGVKSQDSKRYDSHIWPESPLMQQIALCFLYCFLSLWAFCQAVLLLACLVATKILSVCELDSWHILHIPGFFFLLSSYVCGFCVWQL